MDRSSTSSSSGSSFSSSSGSKGLNPPRLLLFLRGARGRSEASPRGGPLELFRGRPEKREFDCDEGAFPCGFGRLTSSFGGPDVLRGGAILFRGGVGGDAEPVGNFLINSNAFADDSWALVLDGWLLWPFSADWAAVLLSSLTCPGSVHLDKQRPRAGRVEERRCMLNKSRCDNRVSMQ